MTPNICLALLYSPSLSPNEKPTRWRESPVLSRLVLQPYPFNLKEPDIFTPWDKKGLLEKVRAFEQLWQYSQVPLGGAIAKSIGTSTTKRKSNTFNRSR